MKLTVGVTGHRDLVPAEIPAIEACVRNFLGELDARFPGLELQVLSALAEGADQLVAGAAAELGIPVVAVLPFAREIYEDRFESADGLERFREMAASARIITLPPVEGARGDDIRSDETLRARQYAQLGVFISNHSQVLLALWDGKSSDQVGGTAGVVNYHLTAVMPGYELAEESPNLLADNENDLAYIVTCSRDRHDGRPAGGREPLERYWMTAHFGRSTEDRMPEEYARMLRSLEDFNGDLERHRDRIHEQAASLLGGAPDLSVPASAELVDRLFRGADWLANHFQRRVSRGLLFNHAVAVMMGVVFIIYSEYEGPGWLVTAFLALFAAGFVVHFSDRRRHWHRKYLDYRALAEGLRVQFYWNLSGVVQTRSAAFEYDNFLQKQDVDLGWIRHVMRNASLERDRLHEPDPGWLKWVVEHWIGTREGEQGQLGYYRIKAAQKERNFRRTTLMGAVALWCGIAIAFLLAVAAEGISAEGRHVLFILMGVLPLVAGVREAYSHKKAEKELIKQYRFMHKVFGNARSLLDGSRDIRFRRRVLKAVGNAALEEQAEWILMHRERPLEHTRL